MTELKLLILFLYLYLSAINCQLFLKLRKLKPDVWSEYEGNPIVKWLMEKLGVVKAKAVQFLVIAILIYLINGEFLLGLLAGIIVFNVVHDCLEIDEINKELKEERDERTVV